jgi:hypothetical protein
MQLPLYILTSGMRLDVFGDPVGEALILNRTLSDWQQETAVRAGLRPEFIKTLNGIQHPYFLISEDVFFTYRFLSEFVERALAIGKNCRAGIARNLLQDSVVSTHPAESVNGGYTYNLRYIANSEDPEEQAVLLKMDDLAYSTVSFPISISPHRSVIYCSSSKAILQINSPLHLLQANMHQNLECAGERIVSTANQSSQAGSKWNQIGRACNIHPTAYLEGCKVGDFVSIGAYAVLRYSVLGNNVRIADSVNMFRSVIGQNSHVCEQHRVMMSVVYPECFLISGALQFSIIGYASAIFAAWITDARMDGGVIKTVIGEKVMESGMTFLGILMGHRSKITAGVVTAPGRIVPNDTVIHFNPKLVYRGLPSNHPPGQPFYVNEDDS